MTPFQEQFKKQSKLDINNAFIQACVNNNLELVRFLLTSKEIKNNADIHFLTDYCWTMCCVNGSLDVIKYVLSSPELNEHIKIPLNDNKDSFGLAASFGHLNLIKYFLTLPEFVTDSHIAEMKSRAFIKACGTNHMDVLQFLVLEQGIPFDNNIKAYLAEQPNSEAENLFKLRDLNQQLSQELPSDNLNIKKSKI